MVGPIRPEWFARPGLSACQGVLSHYSTRGHRFHPRFPISSSAFGGRLSESRAFFLYLFFFVFNSMDYCAQIKNLNHVAHTLSDWCWFFQSSWRALNIRDLVRSCESHFSFSTSLFSSYACLIYLGTTSPVKGRRCLNVILVLIL